jgi:type II secretion system protein N
MIRTVLPWLAGSAWGALVFLIGLQLFFPSGAAVERLQYELDRASDGAWQLQADKAGLWRATGLKLKGVELLKVNKPTRRSRGDDEEPEASTATRFLVADHIAVRARLLPLLGGSREASFDADLYKGELSGLVGMKGDSLASEGSATSLDLGLIPFEGESLSLDLDGALNLEWDLVIDTQDTTKSTGKLGLEVQGLVLNSASVAGFDLQETSSFTKAELLFQIEDGKAKVKKGALVGDLIDAEIDGDITLSKKFDRSRLHLDLEFTLVEHIDNLVKLLPGAKDARRDDGKYYFTVSGTVLHPSFRAKRERRSSSRSRTPSTASKGRSSASPGLSAGGLVGGGDDEADVDERRKQREERIRERRERLRERREEAQSAREDDDEALDDDLPLDEDEFIDEPPRDFHDELPAMPLDPEFDDLDLREVPFEDDMGEFEDEF